jgi:hypothetical protein
MDSKAEMDLIEEQQRSVFFCAICPAHKCQTLCETSDTPTKKQAVKTACEN